jgi:hypothetical protein
VPAFVFHIRRRYAWPAELLPAFQEDSCSITKQNKKLRGLSPQANYTDRAIAACRRSGQRNGSPWPYSRFSRPEPLIFLPSSSSIVLTRLSGPRSRPNTSHKVCSAGNRTRDLSICSQELWPLDHRGGPVALEHRLNSYSSSFLGSCPGSNPVGQLLFSFLGVEWDWVYLARRPLTGLLYQPRMRDDVCGAVGEMKYWEKTSPSATSTTNPTWSGPGSNPGRRGGKPATNRLSYSTTPLKVELCSSKAGCLKTKLFPVVKENGTDPTSNPNFSWGLSLGVNSH